MTIKDVLHSRLGFQGLTTPLETPAEVVSWFGAVQAQDYFGSLWAIGQRMKKPNEASIEQAVANREIVRTWPMRGTLHFVDPQHVRWMLKLLTPRIIQRAASVYRQAELDKKVFSKGMKVFEKILTGNIQLTRDEMYTALEKAKISTANTRGLHILGYASQQGLICLGPRKGKQPTYTLLEEWLPPVKAISKDEAFARLALIYFRSHGPATLQDFSWWTGLTKTEAQSALSSIEKQLTSESVDGKTFWFSSEAVSVKRKTQTAHLLSAYDEYTVGYTEREVFLDPRHAERSGNGIFSPVILLDGKVEGTWKRTLVKDHVHVDLKPFTKFTDAQTQRITKAAKRYSLFVKKPLKLKIGR